MSSVILWTMIFGMPASSAKSRYRTRNKGWLHRHLGEPCSYCGVTMNCDGGWLGPQAPSKDHRVPRVRGGPDTRENMIVCCRRCNEDKGALTTEEYMAVLAGLASRLDILWNDERSRENNPQHKRKRRTNGHGTPAGS
jgi:5-methylcytosine-specific restriction endonuclease McrA